MDATFSFLISLLQLLKNKNKLDLEARGFLSKEDTFLKLSDVGQVLSEFFPLPAELRDLHPSRNGFQGEQGSSSFFSAQGSLLLCSCCEHPFPHGKAKA